MFSATNDDKAACREFLEAAEYAVVATSNAEGDPEAATVTYITDDDWNLYFFTRRNTRKIKNIRVNKQVAVMIGFGPESVGVQIQGTATILDEKVAEAWMGEFLVKRSGFYSTFLRLEGYDFVGVRVTPTTIRWLNIDEDAEKESQIEIQL